MDRLVILGTGDSMGVPRVYCDCAVCTEARTTGVNRRLRSAALIETEEGSLVLDCGPTWTAQMEAMSIRITEQMLITHAHFDHIGGLPEWADSLRWLGRKGTAYTPAEVAETIIRQFPWLPRQIAFQSNDGGMAFGGWTIKPWKVGHGKNGFSYAYRFERPGFRWAYCSDAINLQGAELDPLRGLDLLVLGTSYYHEEAEFHTRSVYDMTEAFQLLQIVQPQRSVFTHMSHGIDLREAYPLPAGVELARTGLEIPLQNMEHHIKSRG